MKTLLAAFILGVGFLCSVFDLAYLGLLLWARQNLPRPESKAGKEAGPLLPPVIA